MEGNIIERLIAAMERVGAVGKEKQVNAGGVKYTFRGIDDLMNATHPVFVECGIVVTPEVTEVRQSLREVTNDYGKTTEWERVMLTVRYTFTAPDGSSVSATVVGSGLDNSDKASNKAMSGALKYALIQVLDIPTEDIADGDTDRPAVEDNTASRPSPAATTARGGHMADAARQMGLKERIEGEPGDMWTTLTQGMTGAKVTAKDVSNVMNRPFTKADVEAWVAETGSNVTELLKRAQEHKEARG